MENQENPQLSKVKDLVESIRIAMMTTLDDAGNLVSRPMAVQEMDDDGVIWFFTKKSSPKLDQIEHHGQRVCLSFANVSDSSYVSVTGHAEELYNRAKIEELWSPAAKPWFPDGKDDPELTILKVTTDMAEYWDSTSSRMVRFFEMARAIVTGTTYKEGENEKVMV